jgi:hypothetical protein
MYTVKQRSGTVIMFCAKKRILQRYSFLQGGDTTFGFESWIGSAITLPASHVTGQIESYAPCGSSPLISSGRFNEFVGSTLDPQNHPCFMIGYDWTSTLLHMGARCSHEVPTFSLINEGGEGIPDSYYVLIQWVLSSNPWLSDSSSY